MTIQSKAIIVLLSASTSYAALRGQASAKSLREQMVELAEQQKSRKLATTVTGDCTVASFEAAGITTATMAADFGVAVDAVEATLKSRCVAAATPTVDWFDVIGKGRQFDKAFLDGETEWNEMSNAALPLEETAGFITETFNNVAPHLVFELPADDYLTNFNNCKANAGMCCYISNRDGGEPDDNAEVCTVDLFKSPKSNHIQSGRFSPYSAYMGEDDDSIYCHGFAWSNDEDSFSNLVKGNTMFYMSYELGLMQKKFTRNVPGAPMCGCMNQLPTVSNSACVEAKEGYIYDAGAISVNITYGACAEASLAEKMSNMYNAGELTIGQATAAEVRTAADCGEAINDLMQGQGYSKTA
jgi:hypothetical protein